MMMMMTSPANSFRSSRPSAASLGLTDFSHLDMFGSRYKFVNFAAKKEPWFTKLVNPVSIKQLSLYPTPPSSPPALLSAENETDRDRDRDTTLYCKTNEPSTQNHAQVD